MSKKTRRLNQSECYVWPIKEREWIRAKKLNKHHLTPGSRGGKTIPENLLRLDINRHNAWHFNFANLTLLEIIRLLENICSTRKRIARRGMQKGKPKEFYLKSKSRQEKEVEIELLFLNKGHYNAWHFLFGEKTVDEVIEILKRILQAKRRIAKKRACRQRFIRIQNTEQSSKRGSKTSFFLLS